MHTLRLLLDTRCCEAEMEKRFRAVTHIHNVCVKHTRKLLVRLDHNREYQDLGTCTKTPLSQRNKEIGGHTVQRDLYSAFLIRNPDASLAHPDRKKCRDSFETFVTIHDNLISQMKASGLSRKPCFGF